eukprot:3228160-Rhodomonas_salina.4
MSCVSLGACLSGPSRPPSVLLPHALSLAYSLSGTDAHCPFAGAQYLMSVYWVTTTMTQVPSPSASVSPRRQHDQAHQNPLRSVCGLGSQAVCSADRVRVLL